MPGMPHLLLAVQPANAAGHRICSPEVPTWTDLGSTELEHCTAPGAQPTRRRQVLIGNDTGPPADITLPGRLSLCYRLGTCWHLPASRR